MNQPVAPCNDSALSIADRELQLCPIHLGLIEMSGMKNRELHIEESFKSLRPFAPSSLPLLCHEERAKSCHFACTKALLRRFYTHLSPI